MSNEVPDDWRTAPFIELADYVNGRAFKPEDWGTKGLPIIRIAQITNSDAETNFFDGEVDRRNLIDTGDLIFSWSATLAVMRWAKGPAVLNQHLFKVTPAKGIDRDWLQYRLEASIPELAEEAHGTTMKHIRKSTLSSKSTFVPPLDEQRRIAEVLRSVDDALARNVETAQHLWALRSLALAEFFVASDDEDAEETLIGRLRPGWRVTAAVDVCEAVIDCKNRTPPITVDGAAVVRTMNVRRGRFVRANLVRTDAQSFEEWTKRGRPQVGDILITREAPIGEVCAVPADEPVCLGQRMMLFRPRSHELHSAYLLYALQSAGVQEHLLRLAGGSTVGHVRVGDIRQLPIPLPDLQTQVAIAEAMADVDRAIDQTVDAVALIRAQKSALMADLLSGKVRVAASIATTAKPVPPAFKRAVFAAEIVQQLHNDTRFGSVKHEKIVHICELHLGLQADINRHAYKEAAGPYDPKARRSVERIFQQQKWFNVTNVEGNRVVYVPLEKMGGHTDYFARYFGNKRNAVQWIIDLLRPLNTEQCEIVATLYSAWNDLLIDKQQPSDKEIVASVLQWHPRKQEISEDRWLAALPWMRQKGLVPKGIGEKTRVALT
ncbi:restriction endonuclease subunit S [Mesorhizobium sp. J8]|uniref:restriction endonuclease subunit S n=1 Tax=Mesorhizobium sp. J8 TaxID=2777475 RepID=UPI001915E06A|nr:restriction endonuclease subunit S [Mesorhizobium sp. J8]BCM16741.1 hypothetical protein MJ8_05020 [Mesorhizobium sp. J8]